MTQRRLPVVAVAWILAQVIGLQACGPSTDAAPRSSDLLQPNQGCTVIYATDGELMLGGNNEDYYDPLTKVWFIPGEAGTFGRVYFGFEDYFAQGGMNEQGLFFDGLGLDQSLPVSKEGKQRYMGNLTDKAMAECATVDCVAGLFEQYFTRDAWSWQLLFGDATGASAIVEAGAVIRQQGSYQVATNFAQSATPPEEITCWRYQTAVERLESMATLSVDAMRDLLDAVHLDGPAHTLYSNVYDLTNKLVYLYYFHNYDNVVVLNLEEELAQGYHAYDLPSLFPPNQAAEDWTRPQLRKYEMLIESRLDDTLEPAILQAYAGEYELPEGWGPPGQSMTVVAQERSLLLRFPDYRQHELFPQSATSFYHVAFQEADSVIAYEASFGLDENRRIEYLELFPGAGAVIMDRLGPGSFLPEVETPEPTATTMPAATSASIATLTHPATATLIPTSTATLPPTDTPTAPTATTVAEEAAAPSETDGGSNVPWAWMIVPLVILGAVGIWAVLRRGRKRT